MDIVAKQKYYQKAFDLRLKMIHNYSIRFKLNALMSHKIQITVDTEMNNLIKAQAQQMGLSVSSYARLALKSVLPKKTSLLDQSIRDITQNKVEPLTLSKFKDQIDNL